MEDRNTNREAGMFCIVSIGSEDETGQTIYRVDVKYRAGHRPKFLDELLQDPVKQPYLPRPDRHNLSDEPPF